MAAALILLGTVAAVAAALGWALAPLRRPVDEGPEGAPAAARWLTEREAALAELRDLDADRADGRLAEADWRPLRAEAVARGARALAALDALAARGAASEADDVPQEAPAEAVAEHAAAPADGDPSEGRRARGLGEA